MSPEFGAFYLTMITMTTVGYGDVTPHTWTGRIVILIAAVLGIVQISLIVNVVDNLMRLDDNQKNAVD